jgi:hypothetical protein
MQKQAPAEVAQSDGPACWMCRRTSSEINSALSGDTEDEVRIAKEIAATKAAKEALVSNSAKWREGVPDALKEFDIGFVFQNADQFKSMQFLGALLAEGRNTVRELDEVSYAVRKGATIQIGGIPADESLRASIATMLNEFEKKTNRRLKREQDLHDMEYLRLGYLARLTGLKLVEGIDYLKEAGMFYYDLQLEWREKARLTASRRKPVWKLRSVKFKDFPREVSVCTVCERLLKEFRPGADGSPSTKPATQA